MRGRRRSWEGGGGGMRRDERRGFPSKAHHPAEGGGVSVCVCVFHVSVSTECFEHQFKKRPSFVALIFQQPHSMLMSGFEGQPGWRL